MFATLQEKGSRPALMTPARLNAPQGGRVIVDILAEEDFADACAIVIDWDGDIMWNTDTQGPMPQDLKKPVLYLFAHRYFPEIDRRAEIEIALDLDEAFGKDNFDNDVAHAIVNHLEDEFNKKRHEIGRAN